MAKSVVGILHGMWVRSGLKDPNVERKLHQALRSADPDEVIAELDELATQGAMPRKNSVANALYCAIREARIAYVRSQRPTLAELAADPQALEKQQAEIAKLEAEISAMETPRYPATEPPPAKKGSDCLKS